MHQEEESPISKLLQMRRHQQQPPPEYFENFLKEFQQRQRAELLRRPAWRIALERINTRLSETYQTLFGPFSLSHLSYAGASVAVLGIAAVMTTNILQNPGGGSQQHLAANIDAQHQSHPLIRHTLSFQDQRVEPVNAFFSQGGAEINVPDYLREAPRASSIRRQPHYILDARPATYEPPVSF